MPNCVLSEHGYLEVTRSAMPAFNLNASIEDNVDSELRTDYGVNSSGTLSREWGLVR